ncbi:MAG: GAF domain-containing protein, partial [Chloroflexi bacterium]|nr:GAF domain-containing protein [Chloroflexota bacterium]
MLSALNQAALAISSDLSLDRTLQHIVNAARTLVGARYAALGIPDEHGALNQFLVSGMTAEQQAQVGHPPSGLGLLGGIMRQGRIIRIRSIGSDPRSVGFPPGHPRMESFLGVPVRAGGEMLGNIYLTDKIAAPEFSQEDEHVIELLATHAAISIKNARLFQASVERGKQLEARNQELAALNAVAGATSRYLDLDQVLSEALDLVLGVTGADGGEVLLLDEVADELVLALYQGPAPGAFHTRTRFRRGEGFPGRVLATGR